jgi:hypothetical protein
VQSPFALRPVIARLATGVALAMCCLTLPRAARGQADSAQAPPTRPDSVGPRVDAGRVGVARATPVARDSTIKPPISPKRALFTSMLVPGLAQSKLGRNKARLLFGGFEVVSVLMARETLSRLNRAKRAPSTISDSAIVIESVDPLASSPLGFARSGARVHTNLAGRVKARQSQFEDWMALIAFNHLMAAADAFVGAQLWDLPTQVAASRVAPAPGMPGELRVQVGLRWNLP